MAVTFSCPTCGRQLRVRDESIGRRVRCPHCQSAVTVPGDGPASGSTPPAPSRLGGSAPPAPSRLPDRPSAAEPPPPPRPTPPRPPAPVAPSDAWGDEPPARPHNPPVPRVPAASGSSLGFAGDDNPLAPPPKAAAAKPAKKVKAAPARGFGGPDDPFFADREGAWRRFAGGLGWVRFGLFFVALIGVVPVAKEAYTRFQGPLPDGAGWFAPDLGVSLSKREEIDLVGYGGPALFAALSFLLGRLLCSAVPRVTGGKWLFFWSGLLGLTAAVGAAGWFLHGRVPALADVPVKYLMSAALLGVPLAEGFFLAGLLGAAGAVRRPGPAVGRFVLALGLAAVVVTVGWDAYREFGRPKVADMPDLPFYEEAGKMIGWVFIVGLYAGAVKAVRRAVYAKLDPDGEDG